MQVLYKGTCEHCHDRFNYALWHAGLGECSYAYCDTCGMLATIAYRDPRMALLPPTEILNQEIDASWEPHLEPCACGGNFRRGASPRCPLCHLPLSAELATEHIEANLAHLRKNWKWQRSWSDDYFIAMEDPKNPPDTLQAADPFPSSGRRKSKGFWSTLFSRGA